MAITKVTIPDLIDLPTTISSVETNTDGVVLAKGSTIAQNLTVDYLVIAGGGGGGGNNSGGGGAGGYLTSYDSDPSGDNSATLTALSLSTGTNYDVTVGAGGAGVASGISGQNGGIGLNSEISGSGITTLTANGGGCGRASGGAAPGDVNGGSGGGGGYGPSASWPGGDGTALQGGDGADGIGGSPYNGGGGGGAYGDTTSINGANGLVSTIDGGTTTRAGGGGGGQDPNSPSSGGTGGGGAGGTQSYNGGVGTVNTGSGGGGGGYTTGSSGGAGGSGIIILRYPNIFTATYTDVTGGAAGTETAIGTSDKYIIITAGTGTVTFSGTPTTGRPVTGGSYILEDGEFRYNTTDKKVEYYDGANWFTLTSTMAVPQAGTTGVCNYPTTATALYQLESNITDTCGTATALWSGTPAYSTSIKKYGTASAGLFTGGASGNYIDSGVDPDSSTSWSVSFWMYRTNTGNFNYAFGTLSTNAGAADGLILGFYNSGSSGKFDVLWRSGTTTTFRSQGGTTIQDTWTNIIITHDSSGSGSTAYYKNGTLVTPNATYSNPFAGTQTSASNFIFGSAGKFPSERLDGYIDQIRIFPSALTAAQVTALYEETAP
jgi:hypothetical protein